MLPLSRRPNDSLQRPMHLRTQLHTWDTEDARIRDVDSATLSRLLLVHTRRRLKTGLKMGLNSTVLQLNSRVI